MPLHSIISYSRVNGPGVRTGVYFQGCNLGCAECWNPATHAVAGRRKSDVDAVGLKFCRIPKRKV